MFVLDSGLAARLINISPGGASERANPTAAGGLIEGFVLGELQRQLGWSETAPALYHYREHSGAEIDAVLQTPDGRVAALEIKAAATVDRHDIRWLAQLREHLGSRFIGGLILHTGPYAMALGDRLAAVPVDVLWSADASAVP